MHRTAFISQTIISCSRQYRRIILLGTISLIKYSGEREGQRPSEGTTCQICRRARTGASRSSGEQSMANRSNVPSSDQFCDGSVRLNYPRHLIVRFRLQSADVASRNERLVRVDSSGSVAVPRTAGIGAFRLLPRVPAKVFLLNPQRALSLDGGSRSRCPHSRPSRGLEDAGCLCHDGVEDNGGGPDADRPGGRGRRQLA